MWVILSLVTNGILSLGIIMLLIVWRQQEITAFFGTIINSDNQTAQVKPQLGQRHKLNYQQWVEILAQEAKVTAQKRPQKLTILAGDSISLWFPVELLSEDRYWLNQGISGESSEGLLKRLQVFDKTQPEIIFVMIGINDMLRGVKHEIILENQRQIMGYLRKTHPKTQIVVQSILPHSGENATWEGKAKLLAIPNSSIRQFNQKLQAIAKKEGVKYLDLNPLFANQKGELRPEFSTDGLHLSHQGYLVWSSALQLYTQMELQPK